MFIDILCRFHPALSLSGRSENKEYLFGTVKTHFAIPSWRFNLKKKNDMHFNWTQSSWRVFILKLCINYLPSRSSCSTHKMNNFRQGGAKITWYMFKRQYRMYALQQHGVQLFFPTILSSQNRYFVSSGWQALFCLSVANRAGFCANVITM